MVLFNPGHSQNQNHRTAWVGRDLKDHEAPTPLLHAGPPTSTFNTSPDCPGPHPTCPWVWCAGALSPTAGETELTGWEQSCTVHLFSLCFLHLTVIPQGLTVWCCDSRTATAVWINGFCSFQHGCLALSEMKPRRFHDYSRGDHLGLNLGVYTYIFGICYSLLTTY